MALPKNIRITRNKDYNNAYNKGKRYVGRYIVLFIKENGLGNCRIGIVTSKKVGKAVTRNRAKRQLRHILYDKVGLFQKNCDIVIVTRYNIAGVESKQIERDVVFLAKKGGLC
jgi:ribonuclease P protein component